MKNRLKLRLLGKINASSAIKFSKSIAKIIVKERCSRSPSRRLAANSVAIEPVPDVHISYEFSQNKAVIMVSKILVLATSRSLPKWGEPAEYVTVSSF